jgi:hypothetical protein
MLSLGLPPCAMPALTSGEPGLDKLLMQAADAAGVPVAPLEPWDTLFGILQALPQDDQIAMLRTGLIDDALQAELFAAMLDGYFAGRVAEVWELGRAAMAFAPGLDPAAGAAAFALTEQLLLSGRNRAWMEVIAAQAKVHDRIVLAAGAAHLPGDAGLLALLAAQGWQIAPLE